MERGTSIYTKRFTDVNDTVGVAIVLAEAFTEIMIHYEGTQVIAKRRGTLAGSESINVTADGYSEVFPLVTSSSRSVMTVFAPTALATINLSVTAWR